jgi:hypothetical protein
MSITCEYNQMNKNQIKPIAESKKELEDVLLKIKEVNPIPSPRIKFKRSTKAKGNNKY